MSITDKDLLCPACKGVGDVPCDCGCPNCEGEAFCDECNGTSINTEHVDLDAWEVAVDTLRTDLGYTPRRALRTNGLWVGLAAYGGRKHVIYLKDYLLPKAKAYCHE